MSQKSVAIVVAIVAAVAAFFASSSLFGGGGSRLRPTKTPKLEVGWSDWESWANRISIAFPPAYVAHNVQSGAVSRYMSDVNEGHPEMGEMIKAAIAMPTTLVTAIEINPANAKTFTNFFNVELRKGWPKMSVDDFVASVKKDPAKTFPGAKNQTAEPFDHPNGKIAKAEYESSLKDGAGKAQLVHSTAYVLINGDDAHVITFHTLKERLAKVKPTFDKTIQNLRVTFG